MLRRSAANRKRSWKMEWASEKKQSKRAIGNKFSSVGLIFGLLIFLVGIILWQTRENTIKNGRSSRHTGELHEEESLRDLAASAPQERMLSADGQYEYSLEYLSPQSDGLRESFDKRLVRKNQETGEREVLIANIKEAIPELKEKFNYSAQIFALPIGKVILKTVFEHTDDSAGDLYSFDPTTGALYSMKINEVYDGFYGGFAMAPDQRRFVWVPNENHTGNQQKMFLIDLLGDSYKIVLTLKDVETLNAGYFALSSSFNISWTDQDTVLYAVYDSTKKQREDLDQAGNLLDRQSALIEYRELDL